MAGFILKIGAFSLLSNKLAGYCTRTLILMTYDADKKFFSTTGELGTVEFLRIICTDKPRLVLVLPS
jgi:hypothetical protein